jgi:hypothetical protein
MQYRWPLVLAGCFAPILAQQAVSVFHAQTNLALVTFQLKGGPALPNLHADDISIREDGIPQRIAFVERANSPGVLSDVVLLFDCGLRTRNAGCLNPRFVSKRLLDQYENTRLSVYGFSDSLYRMLKPSRSVEQIEIAMDSLQRVPAGRTMKNPIIEAILSAVTVSGSAPHAMVIVTEGMERVCQMPPGNYEETIAVAKKYGIALFPVVMSPLMGPAATAIDRERPRAEMLLRLGPATGGKSFTRVGVFNGELEEILRLLTKRSELQYVAGYYPSTSPEPQQHQVEIVLHSKIAGEITQGQYMSMH